jgi:hypothetical protein
VLKERSAAPVALQTVLLTHQFHSHAIIMVIVPPQPRQEQYGRPKTLSIGCVHLDAFRMKEKRRVRHDAAIEAVQSKRIREAGSSLTF